MANLLMKVPRGQLRNQEETSTLKGYYVILLFWLHFLKDANILDFTRCQIDEFSYSIHLDLNQMFKVPRHYRQLALSSILSFDDIQEICQFGNVSKVSTSTGGEILLVLNPFSYSTPLMIEWQGKCQAISSDD